MKYNIIIKHINNLDRTNRLLYGIMFVIVLFMGTASVLDMPHRVYHSITQFSTVCMVILLFICYLKHQNRDLFTSSIFVLVSFSFEVLLYLDKFEPHAYLIPLLMPLAILFTLPLKRGLSLSILHYSLFCVKHPT